jgi:hypothetical protein
MGCDIHVCFEQSIDGIWHNIDEYKKNEYYGDEEYEPQFWRDDVYKGRNYYLFATLANVRNWDGETPCMSEPKGMPDDVSDKTMAEFNSWGSDGHSESYHTLYELEEYNKTSPYYGLVSIRYEFDTNLPEDDKWLYGETGPLEEMIRQIYKRLNKMGVKDINPKQYRIVFWFDN